jgi:hypothetical protein
MASESKDKEKHTPWTEVRSWAALLISLLAVGFTGGQAWTTSLRPARVEGDLSYVVVWRFSSGNNGVVTDVALTPAFWLQNVGARPVVVKDLRMVLIPKDQDAILSFPVSSVPLTAIEASNEFNEYGRISAGSPFRSFGLTASQLWISAYRFNTSLDSLQKLVGEVGVRIQIRTKGCPKWRTVLTDSLDFGRAPYHLQPMLGGAQSIPVYTHRWSLRTEK